MGGAVAGVLHGIGKGEVRGEKEEEEEGCGVVW